MSQVRIPAGPWPDWAKDQRSWQEVARTVELGGRDRRNMTADERAELLALVMKAARNNPPPPPQRAA